LSLIDNKTPEIVFADTVVPLRRFNERRGRQYFTLHPDPARPTYWQSPATRTGGMEQVLRSGSEHDMLDRLGAHWAATGDTTLPKLLDDLKSLQTEILAERIPKETTEQALPEFVYPLC
jgi:hypothetical protein